MNNPIVIGNLVSLFGCILMVLTGFLRNRKTILTVQCVQFGFLATANLILGGVTGFVSGTISILRNLVFFNGRKSTLLKFLFISVQILLSLNHLHSLIEWFPIFSAVIYTWFLDTENPIVLKGSIMGAQALWLIYDLIYQNYTAAFFDVFTILSNIIGILIVRKASK